MAFFVSCQIARLLCSEIIYLSRMIGESPCESSDGSVQGNEAEFKRARRDMDSMGTCGVGPEEAHGRRRCATGPLFDYSEEAIS
jgi:hypothetical protein